MVPVKYGLVYCLYVCVLMFTHVARVLINRVRFCQCCSCLAEQGKLIFLCPRLRLRMWSRETDSAVPSRVSLLISILRLNLVLGFLPIPAAASIYIQHTVNRHTPSGQSRVYRVTQLRTDSVHWRESAGTGPVNLKVVPNEC